MSESETASTESDFEALEALQEDASELERIQNLLDQFNMFETTGFIGQEAMHSRFLALVLDPKQNHGLGDGRDHIRRYRFLRPGDDARGNGE